MTSGEYHLVVEQGATWTSGFAMPEVERGPRPSLAGAAVRAQIRRGTPGRPGALLFDFAATPGAVDTADAAAGVVWLTLSAAQSAALPAGTHAFDLFIDLGTTSRLLRGTVDVRPRVTR